MDLGERLRTIYDAAFSEDDWSTALDALQIGTKTAGMILFDTSDRRGFSYTAHGVSNSYSWIGEHLAGYNAIMHDEELSSGLDLEGSTFMHEQPAFVANRDDDIWPINAEYLERPEIKYSTEKLKIFRRFFVNLSEDPISYSAMLALYDSGRSAPAELADMRQVELLSPHLAKALEINRTLSGLRKKYNAALSVLDHIDIAICIINESGDVVLTNKRAKQLFDERDGIWLDRDGKINCRIPADKDVLLSATTRIAKTAAGQNDERSEHLTVSRGSTQDPLLAIVSPLRDSDVELEPGLSGALLTLIDGQNSANHKTQMIASAYGLTAAEQRVLPELLTGRSNKETAEVLNVSPETIKSHVSSILRKTQSRNRLALIWRVFQFSPPML